MAEKGCAGYFPLSKLDQRLGGASCASFICQVDRVSTDELIETSRVVLPVLEQAQGPHELHAFARLGLTDVVREATFVYSHLGVPDTSDGRLEMIMITAALVIRRLKRDGARVKNSRRRCSDLMFCRYRSQFRRQGVGDLSVGSVKRAAATFSSRRQHISKEMALAMKIW
ncbi:MAG: ubiquinol-cytochrome C chaperone family protein [Geminicoccaceae bacterium]